MDSSYRFSFAIGFEEIKLPPFDDILIMAKNSPQGKIGLSKSFEMLIPNGFELFEINDDEIIEAVFIHRRILKKVGSEKVLKILQAKIFPFISEGELIKVNFRVSISIEMEENELL